MTYCRTDRRQRCHDLRRFRRQSRSARGTRTSRRSSLRGRAANAARSPDRGQRSPGIFQAFEKLQFCEKIYKFLKIQICKKCIGL